MSPILVRQLHSFLLLILICAFTGVAYELIETGSLTFWGPIMGGALGFALGLLERSRFSTVAGKFPFGAAVVMKAVVYAMVVAIPFLLLGFVGGLLEGKNLSDYVAWIFSWAFLANVAISFGLYLIIIFFRHLDRLLGPGVLMRYLVGTYHRPRLENRIFMFLDLKSSTTLAERLDRESYYSFLNTFFGDMTEPILATSAEVYQYVGDEIVLTWRWEEGVRDANCLRFFSELDRKMESAQSRYRERFGVIPEYKAGLHGGEVVTAEIGDLKKDIVYNGDTLNTASRIQEQCNTLGKRLLASASLVEQLKLPPSFLPERLGPVRLEGKSLPIDLVALA